MDLLALTGSVPGYSATTLHLRYIVRRRNLNAGAPGRQRRRWLDFHHTRYRPCSGSQLPAEFNGFSTLPGRTGPLRPDRSCCAHTPPFLTSTQTNGVSVRLPPPPDMLSTGNRRHDAYPRFTPSRE